MLRGCLVTLCVIALLFLLLTAAFTIRPSQGQEPIFRSKALCDAAAAYAISTEPDAPTRSLEAFKLDNPDFCLNATVRHPNYDGWQPAPLIDQILEGTTFVYVKYGEHWQRTTGRSGRIIAVTRDGARDPT